MEGGLSSGSVIDGMHKGVTSKDPDHVDRRILVAYSNASTFTTTTMEYVASFAQHAKAEVHYLHVTHGARPRVDLNSYDVVLLSYCARLCFPGYVSDHFLKLLDGFDGVRAIAIQDEYDFVEHERAGLDRLRPHVVFTCIPPDQLEFIYPRARYPHTDFVQVLTGYVPASIASTEPGRPLSERRIVVGYRGRDIGRRYGDLGRMKFEIGKIFKAFCDAHGVACDIAMDEASRIYGERWYRWLGECRSVLGSESGSNVFDFDGTIAAACQEAQGAALPLDIQDRIRELDGRFKMGQISPRIFEAAATRTALVLYEGRYSDAIRPHEHYIPVAHDHSNLDAVLKSLRDMAGLEAMVERTHAHLIRSGQFSYGAFVRKVESALERHMRGGPRTDRTSTKSASAPCDGPALEEWPTLAPREYAVFEQRQIRAQYERLPATAKAFLVATRGMSLESRLRKLLPSRLRRWVKRALLGSGAS